MKFLRAIAAIIIGVENPKWPEPRHRVQSKVDAKQYRYVHIGRDIIVSAWKILDYRLFNDDTWVLSLEDGSRAHIPASIKVNKCDYYIMSNCSTNGHVVLNDEFFMEYTKVRCAK